MWGNTFQGSLKPKEKNLTDVWTARQNIDTDSYRKQLEHTHHVPQKSDTSHFQEPNQSVGQGLMESICHLYKSSDPQTVTTGNCSDLLIYN